MTKQEKRKFITSLVRSVEKTILAKVDEMPEEWDGHELRTYIIDKVAEGVSIGPLKGSRLREYKNTLMVTNL